VTDIAPLQATTVARARLSLDDACGHLDDAVRSLSEFEGETVMANADLVSLLLGVVAARRHLVDVERDKPAAGPPTSLR
jgi:hypothetical protein